MSEAAQQLDQTSEYREFRVKKVVSTSSSISIYVDSEFRGFALERSVAQNYGVTKVKLGDTIAVKGKNGNSDDALRGMNVIADLKLVSSRS